MASKRSSRFAYPGKRVAGDPLYVHREARIVPIGESLLAPGRGAAGIACQVSRHVPHGGGARRGPTDSQSARRPGVRSGRMPTVRSLSCLT